MTSSGPEDLRAASANHSEIAEPYSWPQRTCNCVRLGRRGSSDMGHDYQPIDGARDDADGRPRGVRKVSRDGAGAGLRQESLIQPLAGSADRDGMNDVLMLEVHGETRVFP